MKGSVMQQTVEEKGNVVTLLEEAIAILQKDRARLTAQLEVLMGIARTKAGSATTARPKRRKEKVFRNRWRASYPGLMRHADPGTRIEARTILAKNGYMAAVEFLRNRKG